MAKPRHYVRHPSYVPNAASPITPSQMRSPFESLELLHLLNPKEALVVQTIRGGDC